MTCLPNVMLLECKTEAGMENRSTRYRHWLFPRFLTCLQEGYVTALYKLGWGDIKGHITLLVCSLSFSSFPSITAKKTTQTRQKSDTRPTGLTSRSHVSFWRHKGRIHCLAFSTFRVCPHSLVHAHSVHQSRQWLVRSFSYHIT